MAQEQHSKALIEDFGDRRNVTITGPHYDMGRYITADESFETIYSRELLELILKIYTPQYMKDEISRAEVPEYLLHPMEAAICPIVSLQDKTVLDFGSGCGASSVILCRLGSGNVHSVEIKEDMVRATALRARDAGLESSIAAHHVPETLHLPFESGSFDVIVCNAVLEHIHPNRRREHITELWRTLKPGGYLFVLETPNRLWPKDGHTTGLLFVPYLPLSLARRYAILFSKRVSSDESIDDLAARGIRGVTFREIARACDGYVYIPNNDIERYFESSTLGQTDRKKSVKRYAMKMYKIVEASLCRPFSVPVAALLPALSLCFKKEL